MNSPDHLALLPRSRAVVVTAGCLLRGFEAALLSRHFTAALSIPFRDSGMYRPNWWQTGSRDEIEMYQIQIWISADFQAASALSAPYDNFCNNMRMAMGEYPPSPPRPGRIPPCPRTCPMDQLPGPYGHWMGRAYTRVGGRH